MSTRTPITRRQCLTLASGCVATAALKSDAAVQHAKSPSDILLEVTDWRKAASQGWTLPPGGISGTELLHLTMGAAGTGGEIAATYGLPLVTPDRFELSVRMRFVRIGTDDDSTGPKSHLHLKVGAAHAQGNIGATIEFTGDRYKVDEQYKIFRTKSEWHDWRLEFDASRGQVAMFRDGEYFCLHRTGHGSPVGLAFLATGSPDVPVEIEVGALRIRALPPAGQAPRAVPLPPEAGVAAAEWPAWRRDLRNTGVSPMKGNLRSPGIAWKQFVGGVLAEPTLLDVDGDGSLEVVVSHGGNLAVFRLDGTPLWKRHAMDATAFVAADIDGDGETELLITQGIPQHLQVLRGRDGQLLYDCDHFPKSGVFGVRLAKLNPDLKGLQAVVWAPLDPTGYVLSFAEGSAKAKLEFTWDWKMTGFVPPVAIADMDRDGLPEIVAATYDHLYVYDGRTGKERMSLEWPSGRNYGTIAIEDIDGDGYPDVVMLADVLREHIGVIKNEGGKSLRLLWNKFYEQNYPEDHKELRVLNESVADFDGDGKIEIAWSLFDDLADSRWHTLIVDAVSGEVKKDIAGCCLAGAGPLLPGKPPALILSTPSSRTRLNRERLTVWSGAGGSWRQVGQLPKGELIATHNLAEFAPDRWSQVSGIGNGMPTAVVRDGGVYTADRVGSVWSVAFHTVSAAGAVSTSWKHRLTGLPDGKPTHLVGRSAADRKTLFAGTDGALYAAGKDETHKIDAQVGFSTVPVVGRMRSGEAPSILFLDSKGDACCLRSKSSGRAPSVVWKVPSIDMPSMPSLGALRPTGCWCVPMLADLNGSGERVALMARAPGSLVAVGSDGETRQKWRLPATPVMWTHGNLTGGKQRDLFVTYPLGAWVDVGSMAIAGDDARTLWTSHCGNGPPAVCDLDGDGRDDITLRDLYEHRTLRGRDGRDIYPITQWAGYHVPTIVELEGSAKPPGVVWVGGSYSLVVESTAGIQRWWKPFMAHGLECAADVDGDGKVEIGGVTAGQLYNWPEFYAVDGPNKQFVCCDALTGEIRWTYPVESGASGVVAADIDGDGKPEFVFSSGDGRLMALTGASSAEKRVLWEIALPASPGMPVVCDADGDGQMEILVGCADGNLYCIKEGV